MEFEWDEEKNRRNQQKHGLSFEEAKDLFLSGTDYLEIFDAQHSEDEDRFITIGSIRKGVAVVVWTAKRGAKRGPKEGQKRAKRGAKRGPKEGQRRRQPKEARAKRGAKRGPMAKRGAKRGAPKEGAKRGPMRFVSHPTETGPRTTLVKLRPS